MSNELVLTQDNVKTRFPVLRQRVWDALQGGSLCVSLKRPSRTRDQEKHYHALISEISKQVKPMGKNHAPDVWKALLVDAFEKDKAEQGEPLRKPSRTVASLDQERLVTVRASTTVFSVNEGRDFIDFLYAFGIDCGVKWSATAQQIRDAQQDGHSQEQSA